MRKCLIHWILQVRRNSQIDTHPFTIIAWKEIMETINQQILMRSYSALINLTTWEIFNLIIAKNFKLSVSTLIRVQ
jgi:hypothetical protein